MQTDVLMLDRVGGAYTVASLARAGLGGSEIEVLQVAKGLTAKGHRVVVANGVESVTVEDGVTFVPHTHAWQHPPSKALYLQRWSTPQTRLEIPSHVRVVVRANDIYCPPYDVHQHLLESGRAALVTNTRWQAGLFTAKESVVIPPMLEDMPNAMKEPGLFVFASGAMKGFEETVERWRRIKARHVDALRRARLAVLTPGWGAPRLLTPAEEADGIFYVGNPAPDEYRRWIAKAEGLFMVLTMAETFCCAAALAERAHTRTHILCLSGLGGLPEAVLDDSLITDDGSQFEERFIHSLHQGWPGEDPEWADLRPSTVIETWADTLGLGATRPVPVALFPADPALAANQPHLGPLFGDFLSLLRSTIAPGGSEFGTGLLLFSIATAIQAQRIVEIGRFKGFSTLAFAAACELQRIGWTEPTVAEQRPDVTYDPPQAGRVISIDPAPRPEAAELLRRAGLAAHVECHDVPSDAFVLDQPIDLLFIDGGHAAAQVRADLQRFVPWVRDGGYFLLHDYYGWFTPDGRNGSPIPQVIAEDLAGCDRVLIDTCYASLVVFRKTQQLTERWELEPKPSALPPRADGRPTVGLCLIAKGDEASTVATRAIRSAQKAGVDCVTVVCDALDATADVARSLGADVFIRPSPAIDWAKGLGVIAGARNEALAIAERRTDYVLVLDADDWFEGTLPTTFDHESYEVTIYDGGLQYQRLQLFRSRYGWRYTGIIHETLGVTGLPGRLTTLRYHRGHSSYGYQDQDPPAQKYSKHAHLARKWLLDHPDDPRMQFYLARSLHDAGRLDEALVAYAHRIAMTHGWEEERSYASYAIGTIQITQGVDPTAALLRAHALGIPKAEPLVALTRWYRDESRRQFSTAYAFARRAAEIPQPVGGIFLERSIYQFEAAAEVAICAYWLGQTQEALDRFTALLPTVPADKRPWAESQIAICRRTLREKGV